MKKARYLLSLLLTLAMIVTFMPLTPVEAAADSRVPVSLEYYSPEPLTGEVGTSGFDYYIEGSEFTVTYSNEEVEVYKFVDTDSEEDEYVDDTDSDEDEYEDEEDVE
ncbi:MAG: hypothetical protein E7220_00215 [Clostridiales bacterium]|nr:hypothetical protein [Clostridiales bacterium]